MRRAAIEIVVDAIQVLDWRAQRAPLPRAHSPTTERSRSANVSQQWRADVAIAQRNQWERVGAHSKAGDWLKPERKRQSDGDGCKFRLVVTFVHCARATRSPLARVRLATLLANAHHTNANYDYCTC